MFYIQDTRSYVGNAVLWWAKEGKGYTTDLDEAALYTAEEAARIHRNRESDKPIAQSIAEQAVVRCVDATRLREARSKKAPEGTTTKEVT